VSADDPKAEWLRNALRESLRDYGVRYVLSEVAYEIEIMAVEAERNGDRHGARAGRTLAVATRHLRDQIREHKA